MKKIKLQCTTGGHEFGDVVTISKDGITAEVAKGLVNEGLAVEVADEATTSSSKVEAGKIISDAKVEAGKIISDAKVEAKTQVDVTIADAKTEAEGIVTAAKEKVKKKK